MKDSTKGALGAAIAVPLVLGGAYAVPAVANAQEADAPNASAQAASDSQAGLNWENETQDVALPQVEGEFSYSQECIASVQEIFEAFAKAPQYLCDKLGSSSETAGNAGTERESLDSDAWEFSVTGDVAHPYTTTVGKMVAAQDSESGSDARVSKIIGCTCAGNRAGGRATVNALATGLDLKTLVGQAGVSDDANAITLIASDGDSVTIPLWYPFVHTSVLAYELNGEPISHAMGDDVAAQLWMDSTAAGYYLRNVVEIRVETLDDEPEAPGASDEYANRPNVTVLSGE